MGNLYRLIQSAYNTAKEHTDGYPIDSIQLGQSVGYLINNKKRLEVIAEFDEISQALQGISIRLTENSANGTFIEEELKSFANFIGNPSYLALLGFNYKDSILDPTFDLNISYKNFISIAKFKSKDHEMKEGIDYDELGKMFGINLKKRDENLTSRSFKRIDSSKIPEVYEWTALKDFSQLLFLSSEYKKSKDKKNIFIYTKFDHYTGSLTNKFKLEDRIDYADGKNRAITPEQADIIETKIGEYRGTDLSQMPFYMKRFNVFVNKPDLPSLKS